MPRQSHSQPSDRNSTKPSPSKRCCRPLSRQREMLLWRYLLCSMKALPTEHLYSRQRKPELSWTLLLSCQFVAPRRTAGLGLQQRQSPEAVEIRELRPPQSSPPTPSGHLSPSLLHSHQPDRQTCYRRSAIAQSQLRRLRQSRPEQHLEAERPTGLLAFEPLRSSGF